MVAKIRRKEEVRRRKKILLNIEKEGDGSRLIWRETKWRGKEEMEAVEVDGKIVTDPSCVRECITEHFKELGRKGESREEVGSEIHTDRESEEMFDKEISEAECCKAVKQLKNRKATGLYEIANEFIKHGGKNLIAAMRKIFEWMRKCEWTPEEWTQEEVKMLHKGKSKMKLDNFRGISISSNVGKVFARIIEARITDTAERRGWLGEIQNAFRKNRRGDG